MVGQADGGDTSSFPARKQRRGLMNQCKAVKLVRPPKFPSEAAAEVASSQKARASSKKARRSAEESVTRLVLELWSLRSPPVWPAIRRRTARCSGLFQSPCGVWILKRCTEPTESTAKAIPRITTFWSDILTMVIVLCTSNSNTYI